MGLIAAAKTAISSGLADQWVDYFRCDSIPETVLMKPGTRVVGNGSSNTKFTDNIISNGSQIDVADNQCMIIVENGKIVDFCQEPGRYIYNNKTQPSLLGGGTADFLPACQEILNRWKAGGAATATQKIYYVNLKEIHGNKIGLGNIPFRDSEFGFTVKVQGYGNYSYRISNAILFYQNLAGNMVGEYRREKIDAQLKSELIMAVQPALGRIAASGISYDQLINYPKQIGEEVNKEMSAEWEQRRGIKIEMVAFESLTVDDASAKKIAQFQESRVYTNKSMLEAERGLSQAAAFRNMGNNKEGASGMDMIGMAMAMNMMGGNNNNPLQQMSGGAPIPVMPQPQQAGTIPSNIQNANVTSWTCACGATCTGKFCMECGTKKPEENYWVCTCGNQNKGKFCPECGQKKPVGVPQYKCDKCGWEPVDPQNPPKFCPECGDPFGDEDIK